MIGLDVGCSTGGFTDCLLQRGATRIYAVDVGYGTIRVEASVKIHVLSCSNGPTFGMLTVPLVPEPIDLAVIDVSFISLTLVLPAVVPLLPAMPAVVVALVKPQFEVGKGQVGEGDRTR